MSKIELSLCMIVKNEEQFIHDCLASVQDVVQQIVIVDTGSTDRTPDIAKDFGAEIYHFDWIDDFSAARNFSIQKARGDWILWLDADERLMEESKPLLENYLTQENKAIAYTIQIMNRMRDGKTYKRSAAHRLFRNFQGIVFEGRIHEQIAYSMSRLGGEERPGAVKLLHLGYGLDEAAQKKKDARNRTLLEKMVRDESNNPYAHFTLAQHYSMTGEPQKALDHFQIAWKKNSFDKAMKASLLNTMAETHVNLQQYDAAAKWCGKSINLVPKQVGAYYMLYRIASEQLQQEQALKYLLETFRNNEALLQSSKTLSTDVLIDRQQLLLTIAALQEKMQQFESALSTYEQLPKKYLQDRQRRMHLARLALQSGNAAKALDLLPQPDNDLGPADLDLAGLILIKNQKFAGAISIYEKLLARMPQNAPLRRRLAGLYAKTGNLQKAQSFLSAAN